MINLSLILSLVILIVTAVIILISVLICARKRLPYSLSRIGCTILAALFSVLISLPLRDAIGTAVYDAALKVLDHDTTELIQSVGSVGTVVETLISLLVAPILFLILFVILFTILSVVSGVILRVLHLASGGASKGRIFQAPGVWIGAAHGLILSLVIFAPLCGYLSVAADTTVALRESIETDYTGEGKDEILGNGMFDVLSVMEGASTSPFVTIIHDTAGQAVFKPLTSGSCRLPDGTNASIRLTSELPELGRLAGTAFALIDRMEVIEESGLLTEADCVLLEKTRSEIMDSTIVSVIGADMVKTASINWTEGKTFAGISVPETEPVLKPTVQAALKIFTDENTTYLDADLKTIIELARLISASNILEKGLSNDALMQLLGSNKETGEQSLMKSIQSCLRENPHMSPLADEIDSLSVRVVALVLDQSGLNDGKYDDALNSVAATVNEVVHMKPEERAEIIQKGVSDALNDYEEIDIPEDVAISLCEKVITDLAEEEKEITGADLKQYLIDHLDELAGEYGDYIPDDFDPDDLDPDDIDDFLDENPDFTLPESIPDLTPND